MLKAREEVRQKESSTTNLSTNNKEQKQPSTSNINNNNNNKPTNTYENFTLPDPSSRRFSNALQTPIDNKDVSDSKVAVGKSTTTGDPDRNDDDMNMYERQDSTDDEVQNEEEEVYQNFSVINSHYNKKNKNTSPRDSTIISFSTATTTLPSSDKNGITTTATTTKPQLNTFASSTSSSSFSSSFLSKTMSLDASSSSRHDGELAMHQLSSFSSNREKFTSSTSSAKNKSVTLPSKKASSFTPSDTDVVDSNKQKPKFYSLRPPKKPPRVSVLDSHSTDKSVKKNDNEKNKENLGPVCRIVNNRTCGEDSMVDCHFFLYFSN